jgi:hypothetical protein
MKDQLFMLKPGFFDGEHGPFYCGDGIAIEGLLGMFPVLRNAIDIHYVEFTKPRSAIAGQIGVANQSVPVLVIADPAAATGFAFKSGQDKFFLDDQLQIRQYLSQRYGVATPR